MNEKEDIIVKYARIYENKIKSLNYDNNTIERLLNEWIKNALKFLKDNNDLTKEELEEYLREDKIVLK